MGKPRLSTMPTQDSAPPPLAAEITRLRSLGRHNEAEMLAGVLREVMVANQPADRSSQGDYYAGDVPQQQSKPETTFERICSLQKQIEKVQFETVNPVASSQYNPSSQNDYYSEGGVSRGYSEVSSVDEATRKVYEMALTAVEQEVSSPETHQERVAALTSQLDATRNGEAETAPRKDTCVAAADVIANANKHYSTSPQDLALAAHYVNNPAVNAPAHREYKDYSASSVVQGAQFVGLLQEGAGQHQIHRSADEQRRDDHASRVHQLKSLLAASQSSLEPEEMVTHSEGGEDSSNTRERLRQMAVTHNLHAPGGQYGSAPSPPKLPHTLGYGVASVLPVSESCPSLYAPKASTRIAELKRSMHDVGLNSRHSTGHSNLCWSDLDTRSSHPREPIRPGNLDVSKLSMSALKGQYRNTPKAGYRKTPMGY